MEFRVSFPLGVGAFDLFHPGFFLSKILPQIDPANTDSNDKLKSDEYLLLPSNKYNVKFTGGAGKWGFDVKELLNPACDAETEIEQWQGLCKGDADGNETAHLVAKLRSLAEGSEAAEKKAKMLEVAEMLTSQSCESVVTKKRLCTMKSRLPGGSVFVAEQIDFSVWSARDAAKGLVMRSVSLEGAVPPGLVDTTLAVLKAQYGARLVFGGFPTMLAASLKIPPSSAGDQDPLIYELAA